MDQAAEDRLYEITTYLNGGKHAPGHRDRVRVLSVL
jgi:hypothetical protein